jgi:hypothetical protein
LFSTPTALPTASVRSHASLTYRRRQNYDYHKTRTRVRLYIATDGPLVLVQNIDIYVDCRRRSDCALTLQRSVLWSFVVRVPLLYSRHYVTWLVIDITPHFTVNYRIIVTRNLSTKRC